MGKSWKLSFVALLLGTLIVLVAAPSFAKSSGGAVVHGTHKQRHHPSGPAGQVIVRGQSAGVGGQSSAQGGVLPFTGGEVTLLALAGLAAIGTGTVLLVRRRGVPG